ncbi:2,3-diaminopropionate biosynthesis protein SbnA [Streptomyces sp. NPDC056529]|uniref:2,3-diaminopropionate biosynthesis protein SbnA n=1 Tax=Streptomyces sp. NPDC056529 TaxID=3345855 RepID=UPI003688FE42
MSSTTEQPAAYGARGAEEFGAVHERVYDVGAAQAFLTLPGFRPRFRTTLKLEALNAAGSIKLKTAREMLAAAEDQGLLRPGSALIESTSGNLGIALAMICAAEGYRLTLVTDPNTPAQSVRHMRALGAEVVVVRGRDANGGYLQTRISLIEDRLRITPGLVWLNQYRNPANARAHSRHTMAEILAGFGVPDWLFVGVGSSGTFMGCLQAIREQRLATRLVAVDAVGSVTFGSAPATRRLPGLGASRRPELFVDDGSFTKVRVGERQTVRTCRQVARRYGLLPGASTGTVLSAVTALDEDIPTGSRVLVISPDLGERYLSTLYDDDWVARTLGDDALADLPDAPHSRDCDS